MGEARRRRKGSESGSPLSTGLSGKGVAVFTKKRSVRGLLHHMCCVIKLKAGERGPGAAQSPPEAFSPVPGETNTDSQGENTAVVRLPGKLRDRSTQKPGNPKESPLVLTKGT